MTNLIALDMPAGPAFVDTLRRVWDAGDAALPVDQRLSQRSKADLLARLGVGAVATAEATHRLDTAVECLAGDALVIATSGSTGEPKGVVLTHTAVAASASASCARLGCGAGTRIGWLAFRWLTSAGCRWSPGRCIAGRN